MIVYHVFAFDEFAGTFWQATFTTEDKAETFILHKAEEGVDISDWYVEPYTLDSE